MNKENVINLRTPEQEKVKMSPAPGARKAILQKDQNKIDAYIKNMQKRGTWGGAIELYAAYQLYKINIRLFDVQKKKTTCGKVFTYPSTMELDQNLDNTTINLLRINRNHYDLIVCKEKTTPPTTRRRSPRRHSSLQDKFLLLTKK